MPSSSGRAPPLPAQDLDYQKALAFHRAGRLRDAQNVCERIVRARPEHSDALHLLGAIAFQSGHYSAAAALFARAASLQPGNATFHVNHGNALAQLQQREAALASYDRAIALDPELADAVYNRGNLLQDLGRMDEAIAAYERVIARKPDFAEAHYARGVALESLGRLEDAIAAYDSAIGVNADFFAAFYNRGNLLQEQGQSEAAVASYDRALALRPDFAAAHYNRGNALKDLDRLEDSVTAYGQAITLRPDLIDAHINRGNALSRLGKPQDALESYGRAQALDPAHIEVKRCIFWHHFSELENLPLVETLSGELAVALAKTAPATQQMPEFRVLHDLEQTDYLLKLGYQGDGLEDANRRLREAYDRYCAADNAGQVQFARAELDDIDRFRKIGVWYRGPAPGVCLNPDNDWAAIERQYFASAPEIIHIDNLLSPEALIELRKFCLISTVWKTEYQNQYLGGFAHDGFVNPVLFQTARELQQKMPRIFGGQRLEQLWGFKYNSKMRRGLNAHADFARINLNFWITPDDANLDPETGGLVVYHVPAPATWRWREYNNDHNRQGIHDFLERHHSGRTRIPYRCNRAVLFNSDLFHETDDLSFKTGYENRRVNVTYLFGQRLRTT